MSLLSRLAYVAQSLTDHMPAGIVGRMCVSECPGAGFEHQTHDYPCGLRSHVVYIGGVEIIYDPPSVFRRRLTT